MAKKIDRAHMDSFIGGKKVKDGRQDEPTGERVNFQWWKAPDEDIAGQLAQTIKFIQRHQASRNEQLTVSTRLYGNSAVFNLIGTAFTRANSVNSNPMNTRISFNLCSSVIDTLVSMVARNKVVPTFVTNGGIWGMQKKAKDLSKFTEGCFYENGAHDKLVQQFRDAAVWGDGILHPFRTQDDRVAVERVLPHEIVVDLVESLAAAPRQMHRVKIAERGVILDQFPDYEEVINAAMPASYQEIGSQGTAADLITVSESYHLPSGPKAKDGAKVICVGDRFLERYEWERDYFPFIVRPYVQRLLGYWNQGACERLQVLQGEINRLMVLDQRSRWMQSSFKLLLENGSKVVTQHLNNDIGAIIHYTGTPPQYVCPPAINADNAVQINSLIDKGYKQEGVSEMAAASVKPEGLDSGKAIRAFSDIQSDRFLFIGQQSETAALELASQMIDEAKEIYKDKKKYTVVFPAVKFMETVDWRNINLTKDEYVMKAFPTSSLKDDFSGRLADIQEGMQAGLISPRVGKRLMAFPDVEMADNLSSAAEDLLHKIFEQMLDEGKYRPAEPTMDLVLAKELCLEYYNYADFMEAPEEKLRLLEKFNNSIQELMQPPTPVEANAPEVGAPQAVPAPAPVSNLLPNAPKMAA